MKTFFFAVHTRHPPFNPPPLMSPFFREKISFNFEILRNPRFYQRSFNLKRNYVFFESNQLNRLFFWRIWIPSGSHTTKICICKSKPASSTNRLRCRSNCVSRSVLLRPKPTLVLSLNRGYSFVINFSCATCIFNLFLILSIQIAIFLHIMREANFTGWTLNYFLCIPGSLIKFSVYYHIIYTKWRMNLIKSAWT